jgi:hypothetical protein
MNNLPKIICVGQPKTGTKTLAEIFTLLGIKVSSNPNIYKINNISYLQKNLEIFDFFHDIPYSFNYELIDKQYPDSKFILTIRDENDWFKSLINYQHIPNMSSCYLLNVMYHHEIILNEHKEDVIDLYQKYNNDVITYFKNTPEKLLIINLCDKNKNKNETDIIQKICQFTNLKTPNNFVLPHVNSQTYP